MLQVLHYLDYPVTSVITSFLDCGFTTGDDPSQKKKRKIEQIQRQWHEYQRHHIYHRIYRFADATEIEYQAEKAKEELKKTRR